MDDHYYPPQSSLRVALRSCCPRCGVGKLYKSFLTIADKCNQCDEDFSKIDSGDGPAVFIIMIAGFLLVGGALYVEVAHQPAYWIHAVIWLPLGVLIPLFLLPGMKSWLIAQQYKYKAKQASWDDE